MEDISVRIERITRELKALQLQLHWPTFQDANSGDQDRILNHLLDAGLGHDLKKAVDLLSQFLWCYIESAAARINAEGVDYAQQSVRLGQVTEMLRLLHHSACPLRESLAYIEQTAMTVSRNAEAHVIHNPLTPGEKCLSSLFFDEEKYLSDIKRKTAA